MKKMSEQLTTFKTDHQLDNNLLKSFLEASKDEDFEYLIKKLKLDPKFLMKYTSNLEISSKEYSHCRNCKNILECKNKITGYAFLPTLNGNQLIFNYQACKYEKKLLDEKKYEKNIYLFDIPKEIKEARMNKIYKTDKNRFETIKWLTTFIDNYSKEAKKGLYLHGNFGCGKTYLIAAMFNELARQNVKSAIIFWPEYIRDLKASFDSDFKEKFNYIKKVPLLLIDDIGAENTTAWARDEIFCPLIQYRMQEQLPTFFTSNLTIDELEQHFSVTKNNVDVIKARRIIERIKQLTDDIEMIGKNNRK